ncbi:hypothetical protein ACHQM5_019070 [Ranunculus cassubicifolius]
MSLLEVFLLFIFMIVLAALFFVNLYQILRLDDLQHSYISPYELVPLVNSIVTKEFVLQGALCALFLLTWHWFLFLLSAPVTYYHLMLYLKNKHLVDVTDVFSVVQTEKDYRNVKLGFYSVLLIIVSFRFMSGGAQLLIGQDVGLLDMVWMF